MAGAVHRRTAPQDFTVTKLVIDSLLSKLAGREGFEPSIPDPKSGALPLGDRPSITRQLAICSMSSLIPPITPVGAALRQRPVPTGGRAIHRIPPNRCQSLIQPAHLLAPASPSGTAP